MPESSQLPLQVFSSTTKIYFQHVLCYISILTEMLLKKNPKPWKTSDEPQICSMFCEPLTSATNPAVRATGTSPALRGSSESKETEKNGTGLSVLTSCARPFQPAGLITALGFYPPPTQPQRWANGGAQRGDDRYRGRMRVVLPWWQCLMLSLCYSCQGIICDKFINHLKHNCHK